jgi:hypothetical protein
MIGVNGVHDSAESKSGNTFSDPQNAHTDSGGISEAFCNTAFPQEDIRRHSISKKIFNYNIYKKKRWKPYKKPDGRRKKRKKHNNKKKYLFNEFLQKLLMKPFPIYLCFDAADPDFQFSITNPLQNQFLEPNFAVMTNDNFVHN